MLQVEYYFSFSKKKEAEDRLPCELKVNTELIVFEMRNLLKSSL
jgi:hypothetical protein